MKLKERKIEIIDTTLIELWKNNKSMVKKNSDKVKELIRLIYIVGCDYIEITEDLCEALFPLPDDVEFRLNYSKVFQIKSISDMDKLIKEIETNKIIKKIRIIGLDDLIFYDYEKELHNIKDTFGNKIEICIEDSYFCSTAMTIEWLRIGGEKVVTSFAGIGGHNPLEELVCSIEFIEKINLRGNHKLLPKAVELFEEITGEKVSPTKPFIGKDIFNVESGIHVNGIYKNPETFEPYNPDKIGRFRKIIIGKHSGAKAIEIKLEELNIKYDHKKLDKVLEEVRRKSMENKRGLYNEEIIEIYEKVGNGYE